MRVIGRASQEEEEERRTWVKSRRVERVELMTKIVECRSVGNPEEDVDAGEMGKSENSGTWETFCLDLCRSASSPQRGFGHVFVGTESGDSASHGEWTEAPLHGQAHHSY